MMTMATTIDVVRFGIFMGKLRSSGGQYTARSTFFSVSGIQLA